VDQLHERYDDDDEEEEEEDDDDNDDDDDDNDDYRPVQCCLLQKSVPLPVKQALR